MEVKEYFEQGYDKQIAEQYEEAIIDFNKVLKLDKEFERAYVQRAYCKVKLGDYNGAMDDYKIGLTLNPDDPMTYFNMASVVIFYLDKSTKDISYIQKALELGMNDVEAYYIRGIIYERKKAYQLAINDLTIAIDGDFCTDCCYYLRGKCYLFLDNYEKAIEDLNKSIELDSKNSNAYYWRGFCYEFKEENDNAIIDFTKAIELNPEDNSSYFCRGRCYEELKQYKEAVLDYKKALELGDDDAEEALKNCVENQKITYLNRGYDKLVGGEYIEALEELNIVIAMDKNYERAYVHRACCKYLIKDYRGSLDDFKIAIALNPNDPKSYMNADMAKYYLDKNSTDISYFNKAIKMNPNESGAYYMKGLILMNNVHSYKTALTSFNKAIELEQYCEYYFQRAECYKHLKRYNKAISDYKKALELGDDNAEEAIEACLEKQKEAALSTK